MTQYKVNLEGKIKVGIAKIKTKIIPVYKKKLKKEDFINCIKSLLILINLAFF